MCSEDSKFFTKRNLLIVICLLIICSLLAVGIYFVVQGHEVKCKINKSAKTKEEFKKSFSEELMNDVSEKYLEMIQRNYPKEKEFYKSLKLPSSSIHYKDIQYILQESAANFENIKPIEVNETARIKLIDLSKDLNNRFYALSSKDTDNFKAAEINKVLNEHDFKKFQQGKNEEFYKFVKDIYETWKELYKCVPYHYASEYPEFSKIDKSIREITVTDVDKSTFKIFTLFETIDAFFESNVRLSQFESKH